ncbi:MAG: hypothetical protein GF353_01825 [Candidatus Lokiarchaeota archaeon]|nr:hypothetical protein [Candidatus Lokiarchaeota archaeon]
MERLEKKKLLKVLSMIKGIEKKNQEFENYLTSLDIPSRNKILKEISISIIKNSKLFKESQLNNERMILSKEELDRISKNNFIEEIILKIQNSPSKKVLYLREFLNQFEDISSNDKDVLLQSLKDENKDINEIHQEMESLVEIFKLKDLG